MRLVIVTTVYSYPSEPALRRVTHATNRLLHANNPRKEEGRKSDVPTHDSLDAAGRRVNGAREFANRDAATASHDGSDQLSRQRSRGLDWETLCEVGKSDSGPFVSWCRS